LNHPHKGIEGGAISIAPQGVVLDPAKVSKNEVTRSLARRRWFSTLANMYKGGALNPHPSMGWISTPTAFCEVDRVETTFTAILFIITFVFIDVSWII